MRVLGSRFVARAFPISTEEDVSAQLEMLRKMEHDATHHCWAFALRSERELIERSADAGEPKGTAGLPILQEIRGRRLENCAVIVARWFGGTKLGTGGLVKAYGECAALSLEAASKRLCKTGVKIEVAATYDQQALVFHLASKHHAQVELHTEEIGVRFEVRLGDSELDPFVRELTELSGGKLNANILGRWTS